MNKIIWLINVSSEETLHTFELLCCYSLLYLLICHLGFSWCNVAKHLGASSLATTGSKFKFHGLSCETDLSLLKNFTSDVSFSSMAFSKFEFASGFIRYSVALVLMFNPLHEKAVMTKPTNATFLRPCLSNWDLFIGSVLKILVTIPKIQSRKFGARSKKGGILFQIPESRSFPTRNFLAVLGFLLESNVFKQTANILFLLSGFRGSHT